MKKKVLAIMIVSAMVLSSAAAMAEETTAAGGAPATDVTVSEQTNDTAQATFARNDNLTVVSVEDGRIETTGEDGETVYINTNKAVVYKIDGTELTVEDIKDGDSITVFTRASEPALAIYPPEYTPAVIIVNDEDYAGSVAVSTFTKNPDGEGYINAEKDLVVHMPEGFIENKKIDNDYIVFYTITTMSIPPQAPADKVVLLEEDAAATPAEAKSGEEETADDAQEVESPFVKFENMSVSGLEDGKIELADENGDVTYLNTQEAVVYDVDGTELKAADLKDGDSVTFYVRSNQPTILIYPPVYTPAVIIRNDADYAGSVDVSNYTRAEEGDGYINAEKNLIIHMPEGFVENKKMDNDYIVFYSTTTKSIPPQTTPDKLVLLEEPVIESSYEDVSDDVWYAESVADVTNMGLFNGVSDTEFDPEGDMTRAMFVTVLGRLDGVAVKDACVTGFEDTPGDQYYSSYVAWANMNNIIKGYDDNTFRPDQVVTREEAMQIIFNYCNYKGIGPKDAWAVSVDYADADQIPDYAMDAAMWNVINGYLVADDNGNINPDETADRAEIAYAMDILATQLGK